ncbi:MAG: hypothetical protein WA924_01460 [Burkholderiaceae bacterium]
MPDADADLDVVLTPAVSTFLIFAWFKGRAALVLAAVLAGRAGAEAAFFSPPGLTAALAGLVAAGLVFFAVEVGVFAGFFVAFAMDQLPPEQVLDDGTRAGGKMPLYCLLPTLSITEIPVSSFAPGRLHDPEKTPRP